MSTPAPAAAPSAAAAAAAAAAAGSAAASQKLLAYLKVAVDKNASDLFFTPNAPAYLKVEGELLAMGKQILTPEFTKELAYSMLTPDQVSHLERNLELDLAIQAGSMGR